MISSFPKSETSPSQETLNKPEAYAAALEGLLHQIDLAKTNRMPFDRQLHLFSEFDGLVNDIVLEAVSNGRTFDGAGAAIVSALLGTEIPTS